MLPENPPADGVLILDLDQNQVGSYAGVDQGQALQPRQLRLRYRLRDNKLIIGSNAFFFEEGHADRYTDARYGEFRVNEKGQSILVALRDQNLQTLGSQ